jgi:hypothetical protein
MSISNFLETKILDLVFNATAYGGQATVYTKLHIGDPGEDGTANAAAETDRVATTFGAASGGAISNDNLLEWLAVAGTEVYSHISLWDAAAAGNCLWTGPLAASKSVNAGDTFRIPIGDLDVSLD